jgi:hypothetical protein
VAAPYSYGRYYLNLVALPVSAVVTPPWTAMESDGRLSEQLLGYDHDATPLSRRIQPPPQPSDQGPAAPHEQPHESVEVRPY